MEVTFLFILYIEIAPELVLRESVVLYYAIRYILKVACACKQRL